uniref:Cathepsin L1-like n=1 Tax=Varanus komodoensis TaxID=61221 RepID=A0A8D2KRE1_VARKO
MLQVLMIATSCLLSQQMLSAALDLSLEETWRNWKVTHAKEYPEGEEPVQREIWEKALQMIEKHNHEASQGKHTYELSLNQFSDLTNEEFDQLNGYFPDLEEDYKNVTIFQESATLETPREVDWRRKGYVTPVKNQGACGSCWAFSATGALEGLHFKKTRKLISLSEQNLVDCSWKQGNKGCNHGQSSQAFQYVIDNKGINLESTYPYEKKSDRVAARCTSYSEVERRNLRALEQAVASIGPISISIDASSEQFKSYKNGKMSFEKDTNLPFGWTRRPLAHTLTLSLLILPHSWSDTWGEAGYMRLARGDHNNCGVADSASLPTM